VAAAAGLKPDDVVLVAAGQVIADPGALSDVIRRQAPGTWLPLVVRRDGRFVDLVAEF
jgi:S1-C subfamily serine protease